MITNIYDNIVNAVQIPERNKARTRFYCDEDVDYGMPGGRWQLVPDIPGAILPNSKNVLGYGQEWRDEVNHILADLDWTPCGYIYPDDEAEGEDEEDGGEEDPNWSGTWYGTPPKNPSGSSSSGGSGDGAAGNSGGTSGNAGEEKDNSNGVEAYTSGEKLQLGVWPDEVEPRFTTSVSSLAESCPRSMVIAWHIC